MTAVLTPLQDILVTLGVFLVGFGIPSVLASLIERRLSVFWLVMVAVGVGLLIWVQMGLPEGMNLLSNWRIVPDAIIRIVARVVG